MDTVASLRPLTTSEELEQALSGATPILILKHSVTCGSSFAALEQVERWLTTPRAAAVRAYVLTVQSHRALANEIARRLGVRHESPQVLLVERGQVRWHTSHAGIRAHALEAALDRLSVHGAP